MKRQRYFLGFPIRSHDYDTKTQPLAVVDDRRTPEQAAATIGMIVATDSGWGQTPGCSYFAVPYATHEEAKIVEANMRRRPEMKRVRDVSVPYRPKLGPGDHLSIRNPAEAYLFFKAGGF